MKIQNIEKILYDIPLITGQIRSGIWINLIDANERNGWGEIAPLPKWSDETLEEAMAQLDERMDQILEIEWTPSNCLKKLSDLDLLPSVSFGLESALLSLLAPIPVFKIPVSALLMGSPEEILKQAALRRKEGFTSAKLKVSNLNFDDAASVIHHLKNTFRLRIDVNRQWPTDKSLNFFAQFPLNTFDYVEEPFQNPKDLVMFPHPLAVDESFPSDLSLKELEAFPTLKALIYKPTMQGGLQACIPLVEWCKKRGVEFVLSSSFESDLGLAHVASLAQRLSLTSPVGIGTYHFFANPSSASPLKFINGHALISPYSKRNFTTEALRGTEGFAF